MSNVGCSQKRVWDPAKSLVERAHNGIVASCEQPGIMRTAHWHPQIEVNYVVQGKMFYKMYGHAATLNEGDICLFWGGLPHQVVDTTPDAMFHAIHLPLLNFFRLALPEGVRHSLIRGATLILHGDNEVDLANFRRWSDYLRSETATKRNLAVDEILLRFERMQFEPFTLIEPRYGFPGLTTREESEAPGNAWRICSHIADNFRSDIDSGSILKSISLHPKYAMNVFKKNTGMTINEYINLLRLSYAQAMLIDNDSDISRISIESGFHSLSAFNGAFRKACGLSPTDFRRGAR